MKVSKKLLKNKNIQWLLCNLIKFYINLVFFTSRWTIINETTVMPYNQPGKNAIFAFWHGRLLLMPKFNPKGQKSHAIVSAHTDGEIIARAIELFNISLIRGSSRKGGVGALIEARKMLRQGDNIIVSPDGPRGPRMQIHSNIVSLAKMTRVPIIPATFSTSHAKVLRSWDHFLLAFPFGKAIFICGNPIHVTPDSNEDEITGLNQALEDELNRITAEADRLAGITPVQPAEKKDLQIKGNDNEAL